MQRKQLAKRKIYILFDVPDECNDKKWLIEELQKTFGGGDVYSVSINKVLSRLNIKGISGKVERYWIQFKQSIRVIAGSKPEDIIICWNPEAGLILNELSKLLGNRRHIISMNWLTPNPKSKIKRLHKALAENDQKCRIIVNSPVSPKEWKEHLELEHSSNFFVIPDVIDTNIPFYPVQVKEKKYCFTGGMNNRDWDLIAKLAAKNPGIDFVCVALKDKFSVDKDEIPENMKVHFNTPSDVYYELMKNASLILLPLINDRVAGLINILRAAQYGIPCMITRTPSTEQYYGCESEDLLVSGDIDCWNCGVDKWLSMDRFEYTTKTLDFQNYIKKNFTPGKATEKIVDIIDSF